MADPCGSVGQAESLRVKREWFARGGDSSGQCRPRSPTGAAGVLFCCLLTRPCLLLACPDSLRPPPPFSHRAELLAAGGQWVVGAVLVGFSLKGPVKKPLLLFISPLPVVVERRAFSLFSNTLNIAARRSSLSLPCSPTPGHCGSFFCFRLSPFFLCRCLCATPLPWTNRSCRAGVCLLLSPPVVWPR